MSHWDSPININSDNFTPDDFYFGETMSSRTFNQPQEKAKKSKPKPKPAKPAKKVESKEELYCVCR